MRIIAIIFLLCFSFWANAQEENLDYLNPTALKNFGRNAERLQDTYSAVRYYTAYLQKKPNDIPMTYHLAALEEGTRNYVKALEYYTLTFESNNELYLDALYHRGRMLKMLGKYDEAKTELNRYLTSGKKSLDRDQKKLATTEMLGCDTASMLIKNPLAVALNNLGKDVNKPHIEFSPIPVSKDEIIFGSLQEEELKYYELTDVKPKRKLYVATREGDKWVNHGEMAGPFNSDEMNIGNGAFSLDGNRFYFTRCEENWKMEMICHLWMAKRNQRGWDNPIKLDEKVNMPKFSSTQPTVGKESKRNREVIYFVSDRPEGYGGKDVWYTIYDAKKNGHSEARNAGKSINTVRDEITPFYYEKEKKLYYSTDGRSGLGGFDVYYTRGELKQWTPAANVGYPINSSVDDLSYALTESGDNGFIVSNRKGGQQILHETCCDDIYEFYKMNPVHLAVRGLVVEASTEEVMSGNMDAYSKPTISNAQIQVFLIENGQEVFMRTVETTEKGDYLLDLEQDKVYRLVMGKNGFLNNEIKVSTMGYAMSDTLIGHVGLTKTSNDAFILKNIEYDFDSANLTDLARKTIDDYLLKVLNDNPDIKIELSAHTDSRGADDYNKRLSQQRAESVVKYLTQKGVNAKRLVAKGYGETKPIAPNTNPDGTDSEEGRQMNRRTEFKIIGRIELHKKAEEDED